MPDNERVLTFYERSRGRQLKIATAGGYDAACRVRFRLMAETPAAPPAPGRGQQTQYGDARPAASPGNGFAVAALILGIVGVVGGLISFLRPVLYYVALPYGILPVILGVVGRRRSTRAGAPNGGMATAGIVLGGISIALGLAGVVFVIQTSSEEVGMAVS